MDPHEWEFAKQLFEAALAEPPEHRASFVEQTCGGDSALRDLVLWLLGHNDQAGSLLNRPLGEESTIVSASEQRKTVFPIGSILLGRFRIVSLAGRGGMAEVYEAEDLELHDCIALKTIRSEIARDPDSVARFKQEIQLARRVSHPNVIRLFDLFTLPPEEKERRGVTAFVTMQFLSGMTLEDKIRSTAQLEMNETVSLGVQICNGLAAAHKIGIIHRDFKSSNVMLVQSEGGESSAVVTDFGLAFTTAQEGSFGQLTRSGAVIGTPSYMAPEQLEGGAITPATDIYAFGVVLYEMITGERPFPGMSPMAAALQRLRRQPKSLRLIRPELDSRWEAVILKCLEYDAERRYQTAQELGVELVALGATLQHGTTSLLHQSSTQTEPERALHPPDSGSFQRILTVLQKRQTWFLFGFLIVVAAAVLTTWYSSSLRKASAPLRKPQQVTGTSTENPILQSAISPDGKMIAYGDDFGVHLQLISTQESRILLRAERSPDADVWWPADWFPDSNRLLVNSAKTTPAGLQLATWVVSTNAGSKIKLRESCIAQSVSPDGSMIAFTTGGVSSREEVWVMGSQGEAARKLVSAQNRANADSVFSSVRWSPDGGRIAFRRKENDSERVSVESVSLKGGPPAMIASDAELWGDFRWSPNGQLLFPAGSRNKSEDMNLWSFRADPTSNPALRSKRQLTDWIGFSIESLSLSRDGMHLAFDKTSLQTDVFLAEIGAKGFREAPRRFTLDDYDDIPSAWADDDKTLFFTTAHPGNFLIQKQSIDDVQPEVVVTSQSRMGPVRLTPDGSSLLYIAGSGTARRLMLAPASGGIPQEFDLGTRGVPVNVVCSQKPALNCVVGTLDKDHHKLVFWELRPPGLDVRRRFAIDHDWRKGLSWTFSPDGTRIAMNRNYPDHAEIEIYSFDGVLTRRVRLNGFNHFISLDWASDGHSWFVGTGTATGCSLLRVYEDGRDQVLLNMRGRDMQVFAVPSRSGKRVAVFGWTISRNVWVLDQIDQLIGSQ